MATANTTNDHHKIAFYAVVLISFRIAIAAAAIAAAAVTMIKITLIDTSSFSVTTENIFVDCNSSNNCTNS